MNKRDELLLCIARHVRGWLSIRANECRDRWRELHPGEHYNAADCEDYTEGRLELEALIADAREEAALDEHGMMIMQLAERVEALEGPMSARLEGPIHDR